MSTVDAKSTITDLWFRSELSLRTIGSKLGLHRVSRDEEDYWEWIIGFLESWELDITRAHRRPPGQTETRIFLVDGSALPDELIEELVRKLKPFVRGRISCGRWILKSGNEYDLVEVSNHQCSEPS
jgi:hypothetical protein